jgi:hypothetical protein
MQSKQVQNEREPVAETFVSYAWQGPAGNGVSNACLSMRIVSWGDVQDAEDRIKTLLPSRINDKIVITSFHNLSPAPDLQKRVAEIEEENARLTGALLAIQKELLRARGEQGNRDAIRFATSTVRAALSGDVA